MLSRYEINPLEPVLPDTLTNHRPKQARSLKTEQALLDALEALLVQKSFGDLTVSELAREADLTTGAIYRRFKDKEDVLRGAFQRFYERSQFRIETTGEDFPEGMTDRQILEKYFSDLMHFTLDHIHLMRAANHLNDPSSFQLMTEARTLSADWLASRLKSSNLPLAELKHRTRFVLRIATATFRDTFLAGTGAVTEKIRYISDHEADLENLTQNLVDMARDYLSIE